MNGDAQPGGIFFENDDGVVVLYAGERFTDQSEANG